MINRAALSVLVLVMLAASVTTGSLLQSRQHRAEELRQATTADSSALGGSHPDDPGLPLPKPPVPNPPVPDPNPLIIAPPVPPVPPAPPKPPPPPPGPVRVKGTPCLSNVRACVRLSTRQAWLISDGKVILGPVPITSGKSGERTPVGMHQVLWKDKDHLSQEFDDAPMPWSVFFADGGIAFHTGSLRAQSSGCVHLSNSSAKRFFGFLRVGDRVNVVK
ncbi:MAG TPA: L,D-transpeptidase [Pseudonocardia sp.]|jgi:hypothetical protein